MDLKEALIQTRESAEAITGLKVAGVTKVHREDDGWHVGLELVELSRIPHSTDVLGEYEILVGDDGSVLNLERKAVRLRSETGAEVV